MTARPERKPRQHLKLLVPEKLDPAPELAAQSETFYAIARDLPPLFERHWQELGPDKDVLPLDPDWDRYFALAASGILHVTTARYGTSLVGYAMNLVAPHLDSRSARQGIIEKYWLDPAYRGGMFPIRFFRENERMLRDLGVVQVGVSVQNGYKDGRVGLIFRRLRYAPVETHWAKVLR